MYICVCIDALVHLCATGQLDGHDGKITVAEACVTPVVAAKVLAEKHQLAKIFLSINTNSPTKGG